MEDFTAGAGRGTKGHGARGRILSAATRLFYEKGINATGVEELAQAATVSKRTLYQHFPSKDALVAAYLEGFETLRPTPAQRALARSDLSPREQLLAIFDANPGDGGRGCPYLNATAELCAPDHPARRVARDAKRRLIDDLIALSTAAAAEDPASLGHQLAVLFDGARAESATLGSDEPLAYAAAAAAALIDLATPTPGPQHLDPPRRA